MEDAVKQYKQTKAWLHNVMVVQHTLAYNH